MKLLLTASLFSIAAALSLLSTPSAGNPLLQAQRTDERFVGQVEERLEAGSYLYLRVRDDLGDDHWVATLRSTAVTTPRVSVHAFARTPRFESKRVGRAFAPLSFGTVTTPNLESK